MNKQFKIARAECLKIFEDLIFEYLYLESKGKELEIFKKFFNENRNECENFISQVALDCILLIDNENEAIEHIEKRSKHLIEHLSQSEQ